MKSATCHPDRIHYAKGQCKSCYRIQYAPAYYAKNKEHLRLKTRQWYTENKHRKAATTRARHTKAVQQNPNYWREVSRHRRWGLSEVDYLKRVESQNRACFICSRIPPNNVSLDIDHDHETGELRKLLCRRCNLGLGYFLDDPKLLRSAAAYLEGYATKAA